MTNPVIGRHYSSRVSGVESGSIVVYIVTHMVVPVSLNLLACYIYDRLTKKNSKKDPDSTNRLNCDIDVYGDNNTININCDNDNEK